MFPFPHVITDKITDGGFYWGHFGYAQARFTEQLVHWFCGLCCQKGSARITPQIFLGRRYIDRPWRHQSDKHMPIDGEIVYSIVKALEVSIEPVRKLIVDQFDSLAKAPANNRRTAASRFAGKNYCKSLILGGCPHCRFAKPREAKEAHFSSID